MVSRSRPGCSTAAATSRGGEILNTLKATVARLSEALRGHVGNVVYFDVVDSTHAMAIRLIDHADREGLIPDKTLILANRQSRGIGRGKRRWQSPSGGLYLNWVGPGLLREAIARLPMVAAVAARQSVTALGVDGIGIKWPNDIVVSGKKLAGLLVYARHGSVSWATVGLGINLSTVPEMDAEATLPATALAEYAAHGSPETWYQDLAVGFITAFDRALAAPDTALEDWRRHLIHRPGDTVGVRLASGQVVTGTFRGLTTDGFLMLDHDGDERIISGGDVIETG